MSPIDIEQFRLEDYKLKLVNLDAHSGRMWTRFNYFVAIEAGLVGLFAVAGANRVGWLAWGALAEFLISLIWWAVGARDRFLWLAARRNVVRAARMLRAEGWPIDRYEREPGYIPVGDLDFFAKERGNEAKSGGLGARLGSWIGDQDTGMGVTAIPMLIPLLAAVGWWVAFAIALSLRFDPAFAMLAIVPVLAALARWAVPRRHEMRDWPPFRVDLETVLLACLCVLILALLTTTAVVLADGLDDTLAAFVSALLALSVLLAVVLLIFRLVPNRRVAVLASTAVAVLSATLTLTVEPSLSVSLEPNVSISLEGPQGRRGKEGPDGTTGERGATGRRGPTGKTGPQGPTGRRGPTGRTGLRGPTGRPGATYWDGS